jgi:hypothetical protein
MFSIEVFHDYLDQQFATLRDQRPEENPVFALEHGLGPEERQQLTKTVRDSIPGNFPKKNGWLPWIVHATEIGYGFSGQEYWKTFREETPGWWKYGDRNWLREKFEQFSDEYGGIEPSGVWAEQNSFIAWPVVNAILADDLRDHLIDVLHAVRDTLRSEDGQDADRLGRQIRISAQSRSHVSGRFVQFAQQERLVGHIARALLSSGYEVGQALIEKSALRRIVNELEEEQRTQLGEASRSAREGRTASRRADTTEDAVRALRAALSLRPVGEDEYRISLEIPSLEPLLEEDETFESTLTGSDAKIEGAQRHRLPPRTLTAGPTEVRLKTWALPNSKLLKFENAPEEDAAENVATVLNEHLFDTGRGPWLFKLRKDGTAQNIRSRRVRPGSSYVLAGRESELADLDLGTPVHIRADGITGRRIDVGNPLSVWEEEALQEVGLDVKGEVDVWPAGVVPASFDGQEEATWLTTDTPMLGIYSNLAVTRYEVSLNGGEATSTVAAPEEGPVFVKVPGLRVGPHTLTISAETSSDQREEQLRIKIRRPERNRGENAKIWPLHVVVASPSTSMEELWETEVELSAQGPRGREVEVSLELYAQDGTKPLATTTAVMRLPITKDDWEDFVQEHCLRNADLVEHFEEAYEADVTIDGGIIGSKTIPFERRHTLLRWKLIEQEGARRIQLLDDTDGGPQTQICRYAPEQPLTSTRLDVSGPEQIFETDPSGGLWRAEAGEYTATRIVSPGEAEVQWGCEGIDSIPEEIKQVIHGLCLWKNADSRDNDSIELQKIVLDRLQEMIVRALCGAEWMEKEKRWLADPTEGNRKDLEAMIDKVLGRAKPVKEALDDSGVTPGIEEMKGWIRDNRWLPQRRRIKNIGAGARVQDLGGLSRSGLARFSIRVMGDASAPAGWETFDESIKQLVDNPDLARTARAVVLARRVSTADTDLTAEPVEA